MLTESVIAQNRAWPCNCASRQKIPFRERLELPRFILIRVSLDHPAMGVGSSVTPSGFTVLRTKSAARLSPGVRSSQKVPAQSSTVRPTIRQQPNHAPQLLCRIRLSSARPPGFAGASPSARRNLPCRKPPSFIMNPTRGILKRAVSREYSSPPNPESRNL